MTLLSDIVAIAEQAIAAINKATESDWAPILVDALESIVGLCKMELDEKEKASE